jgi:3-methyladenine DNA glycosylase/8-oxoguanine DNA glycosylase
MRIESKPPHDFYLTLDVDEYFEAEYEPEEIFKGGLARPLNLADRVVLAVIHYNENPVEPAFEVEFPDQAAPSAAEQADVRRQVGRIVGSNLDVGAFGEQVADDEVMGPIVDEHFGFKRLSRGNFFEDAVRYIIRTRISHGPTKRNMVQSVRKTWGTAMAYRGRTYYSYPRPEVLKLVEPSDLREFGISKRKGEYITGLAKLVDSEEIDPWALEEMSPADFWEAVIDIRGVGPSTAQSLMFRRNRHDGHFFSRKTKVSGKDKREEKGWRRWILPSYGVDPHEASDEDYEAVRDRWRGFEALVSQYLFYDWLMAEKEKEHE